MSDDKKIPTGVPELDNLMSGGVPAGAVTELYGETTQLAKAAPTVHYQLGCVAGLVSDLHAAVDSGSVEDTHERLECLLTLVDQLVFDFQRHGLLTDTHEILLGELARFNNK